VSYIAFDDIPLAFATTQSKRQRIQRAQFGDGYSQVLTDGLNTDTETWSCETPALTLDEIHSIESYLLSKKGQAITWTPPYSEKSFGRPIVSGELHLGYTNLASLTVKGYTSPTNYTANLSTGLITSVNIPNDTVVYVDLTLSPRTYLLSDGWNITPIIYNYAKLNFELTQVYV